MRIRGSQGLEAWMQAVFGPLSGVAANVLANALEFILAANDMFVVVALPETVARCLAPLVDLTSRIGLEGADDFRKAVAA